MNFTSSSSSSSSSSLSSLLMLIEFTVFITCKPSSSSFSSLIVSSFLWVPNLLLKYHYYNLRFQGRQVMYHCYNQQFLDH